MTNARATTIKIAIGVFSSRQAGLQKLFCRVARQQRSEQTSIERVSNQSYKEASVSMKTNRIFKPAMLPDQCWCAAGSAVRKRAGAAAGAQTGLGTYSGPSPRR